MPDSLSFDPAPCGPGEELEDRTGRRIDTCRAVRGRHLATRARTTPRVGLGLPREVRRVLVRTVDRGVHTDRPVDLAGGVGPGQQRGQDRVPRPVAAEPAVPLPHRLPRPERRRQITPRDPTPIPVQDPLHDLTVITHRPPPTRTLSRQQRLNQLPLVIVEQRFTSHQITLRDTTREPSETRSSPCRRSPATRPAVPR